MAVNKAEYARLVSEVRELARFMFELGVEDMPGLLPASNATSGTQKSANSASERLTAAEIEKVVGTRSASRTVEAEPEEMRPRRDLLGDTKINDMKNVGSPAPARPEQPAPALKAILPVSDVPKALFDEELPERHESIADIRADIGPDCTRCELCENRTQVVNSVGNEHADLMIVGEAPGADEDHQGEPFVGRAGKLLTKILEAIGFSREDVFIGNINRCRPPKNRQPTLEESAMCKPFLLREIASVRPKVIVVLGNTATKNLLSTSTGITKLRGNFAEYYGVKVMPTFHPAYLLRDPRKKREVWDDMKKVRDYLSAA